MAISTVTLQPESVALLVYPTSQVTSFSLYTNLIFLLFLPSLLLVILGSLYDKHCERHHDQHDQLEKQRQQLERMWQLPSNHP